MHSDSQRRLEALTRRRLGMQAQTRHFTVFSSDVCRCAFAMFGNHILSPLSGAVVGSARFGRRLRVNFGFALVRKIYLREYDARSARTPAAPAF